MDTSSFQKKKVIFIDSLEAPGAVLCSGLGQVDVKFQRNGFMFWDRSSIAVLESYSTGHEISLFFIMLARHSLALGSRYTDMIFFSKICFCRSPSYCD